MAIPTDLWLVVPEFTYRYGPPSSPDRDKVRAEAAMTYHVVCGVDGDGAAAGAACLDWCQDLWYPPFANPTTQWCHFEKITATHLATSTEYEREIDFALLGTLAKPLPPQVAVFVAGRAKEIGHQVRRWIPCLGIDRLDDFGLVNQGFLNEWPRRHLIPGFGGTVSITPVIWDAANEVQRSIATIIGSLEYRTIRGRSLRNRDLQVELTPP